jgi:2-hydroxycyclohexanecarboxyl-CoA dehydrogenase
MLLKDHVAVVTGAGQGIGRATAKRLAADGAKVALFDLNKETVEKTAADICEDGSVAKAYVVDCTNQGQVNAAVDQVIADLGSIKILVNNIGWSGASFFEQEDETYWDKVIAINLKAPMMVTHAVLKSMKEAGEGHIVSLASDAARVGQLQGVVYSACKGGVVAFTKGLAREVAKHKINVNCICPGPTETPLYESAITDKIKAAFTQIIPMKRIAQPEEIANAIAFLVNPESGYITGQVLSVSGGLTMAG